MARLARVVLSDVPHHVTQRGNGRARTFFGDADYRLYRDLLVDHGRHYGVGIWGWCLMPNHVHLILTPSDKDGLRVVLSRVHRQYAGHVHARERRTGHFWQGRFGCVAMDEAHLVAAMAYVVLNPLRARLVEKVQDWPWSSIHAYLRPGKGDGVTDVWALTPYLVAAKQIIAAGEEDARFDALRRSETIGRPIGNDAFLRRVEEQVGRTLKPGKRGPKPP
ncbi:MAG: transposase [Gammaproteobacteria bacterium]|nr:transposase [Gammaproteobacteria bacterium]